MAQPIKLLENFQPNNIQFIASNSKKRDILKGTNGNDYLQPGKGRDILIGGRGADQFHFATNDRFGKKGADKIQDFSANQGDQLILSPGRLKGLSSTPQFMSAGSRKQLKKLSEKDLDLIYLVPKGKLFFNQNEDDKGFGNGGRPVAQLLLRRKG